jgi:hypothetical protein
MNAQEQQALDAARYRHLRDFFAIRSDDDQAEFAKLARITGKEFDKAVDESMEMTA